MAYSAKAYIPVSADFDLTGHLPDTRGLQSGGLQAVACNTGPLLKVGRA